MQHFKKYFLTYTITPLTILLVVAAYYRFMVIHDYTVSYGGDCDPYTQDCFVYCEDDECSDPLYYSKIYRNAGVLEKLCGNDVSTCDNASYCPKDEAGCYIQFCDPSTEECDTLTESDLTDTNP